VVDDRGVTDLQRTERETLVRGTLEIDASAPAPRGTLTSAEGRRLEFSGWSELAVAVENFRAGSCPASAAALAEEERSHSERGETS
jgi:hypothetical protein